MNKGQTLEAEGVGADKQRIIGDPLPRRSREMQPARSRRLKNVTHRGL